MAKKQKEPVNCRLGTVGGSAVMEGVMMKNKDRYAVSVRCEDGQIKTTLGRVTSVRTKYKILNIPIVRGVVNMIETMSLSFKTLAQSAEALGIDEEAEETKFEKWLREKFGKSILNFVMAVSGVLGVLLAFALFFFLPAFLTKLLDGAVGGLGWFKNLIEGLIKIGIFLAYIWLVAFMPDIKRTFEYHGAEHKSIFCYEAGEDLTPENAAKYKRFHPRCGTSFLFVILAISILINSLPFVPWDNMLLRVLVKLALLPIVVGLGFEFLMYAGKHDNLLIRILSAPGLWIQRITTREPDLGQLEVAIASLKASMPDVFPPEVKEKEEAGDAGAKAEEESAEEAAE
ncbi:MAG: DUF1385 domain-containing protein [Clostridia bacterium]|nr:DUF1385 domain-containing protein [Clostridia bacterium]